MNFTALCSSFVLFLSFITCSEHIDSTEWERRLKEFEDNLPVMETFENQPKEFVDDPAKNSEYTRVLVWYMIPEEVRAELLHAFLGRSRNEITRCKPPPGMVTIDSRRYLDLDGAEIAAQVQSDRDWINLSNDYTLNSKRYSERTRLNFLIEAIKNASPSTIEEILQRRPHALILLKKIQTKASDELINVVLDSRTSASEIIEIFRVLERYSDLDMANLAYLNNIRLIVYERDDCELLMYTNAYPDLIRPVSACQDDIIRYALKGDKIPKVWSLICDNPHKSADNWMFSSERFIKFRLFSEPVNRKNWTLDMYAVACQEYEMALNVTLCICKKSGAAVTEITNGFSHIAQMIPLIPDPVYRRKFIEKYNYQTIDPNKYLTEFPHINKAGKKCTVKVVPYCEQEDSVYCDTPPVRIANTDALVSKVLQNK